MRPHSTRAPPPRTTERPGPTGCSSPRAWPKWFSRLERRSAASPCVPKHSQPQRPKQPEQRTPSAFSNAAVCARPHPPERTRASSLSTTCSTARLSACADLVLKRHAGPLIGGVVQLSLTGAGDDVLAEFVIDGKHERGVRRGRAPQADASITIDPSTFGALARCSSELTRTKLATACYFSGRLKVSGDLGLAADFYFLTDVVLRSGCSASCELGTEL